MVRIIPVENIEDTRNRIDSLDIELSPEDYPSAIAVKNAIDKIKTSTPEGGSGGGGSTGVTDEQIKEIVDGAIDDALSILEGNTAVSIEDLNGRMKVTEDTLQTVTGWQEGVEANLATIQEKADDNGASISQIVANIGEDGEVTSASIVAAINKAGSTVAINADCINLKGAVTFDSLDGDIADKLNSSIASTKIEYALSNSATDAPKSGWNTTAPQWEENKYMWQKTTITYTDEGKESTITTTCIQGVKGNDGFSIVWKGSLSAAPGNPEKNWVYKNTSNNIVYIYNGTTWEIMVLDGSNGPQGAPGPDGLSVFITYNDSATTPSTPTGNGTSNGWHTAATSTSIWMSQKVAKDAASGTWGTPIKIKGETGDTGNSVTKVTTQYCLSTSNATAPPEHWNDNFDTVLDQYYNAKRQSPNTSYYIWSREEITYSLSDPTYSTPTVNNANSVIANWCDVNDKTKINGANIATGSITANQIGANAITAEKIDAKAITAEKMAVDAITSVNYEKNESGSKLNLEDGSFDSKHVKINNNGIEINNGRILMGGTNPNYDDIKNTLYVSDDAIVAAYMSVGMKIPESVQQNLQPQVNEADRYRLYDINGNGVIDAEDAIAILYGSLDDTNGVEGYITSSKIEITSTGGILCDNGILNNATLKNSNVRGNIKVFPEIHANIDPDTGELSLNVTVGQPTISMNGDTGNISCISVDQTSDENLKNIIEWDPQQDKMFMELNPILYTWKNGIDSQIHIGLGARETKQILEKYNLQNNGIVSYDKLSGTYKIAYNELHGLEINAIQKNRLLIQELECKIKELEEKIAKFENK